MCRAPALLSRQGTIICPTWIFAVDSSLVFPFLPQLPCNYSQRQLEWSFNNAMLLLETVPWSPPPKGKDFLAAFPSEPISYLISSPLLW